MKYRKKPVVIDAERFEPPVIGNLTVYLEKIGVIVYQPPDVVIGSRQVGVPNTHFAQDKYYAVKTLEGVMRVDRGDWIITGVRGEKYPCKPDIFEMTYEKYNEAEQEPQNTATVPAPLSQEEDHA